MTSPELMQQDYPVLVVAYDEKSRASIAVSAGKFGVNVISCASFLEAESYALSGNCRGIMVDLATMVKAKDAEKLIAHTMTRLYPSLRVKTMGSMLIPMIMAGDAKQDKSLNDFLTVTCAAFTPRTLRAGKRRDICIPTAIGDERGFTLNISWGGVFIVDVKPERFSAGQKVSIRLLAASDDEFAVEASVVWIQSWGGRRTPGVGMQFNEINPDLEEKLSAILKSNKNTDHDRLTA